MSDNNRGLIGLDLSFERATFRDAYFCYFTGVFKTMSIRFCDFMVHTNIASILSETLKPKIEETCFFFLSQNRNRHERTQRCRI